ncbi:unnamed protein product [Moneuplotes crassus]|uniref:Uncharacterized protein n=1 Tax=Euplotes crassus TaxID=5936 RepID=A0AAD1UNX9_EUPCR|nr:unnamed protein product [Moneuplotes crassus]
MNNLRVFCIPDCQAFKELKEKYIAVLKKVQNAVGRDLRGFHSPLALQNVLLTWESVKRQTQENDKDFTSEARDSFHTRNRHQDFERN